MSKLLQGKGFFVVRSAKSGVDGVSPDLVALSSSRKFAIECKAREGELWFDKPDFLQMLEWEKVTGLPYFVAWRRNRGEWKFIPLALLRETKGGFVITVEEAQAGLSLDETIK